MNAGDVRAALKRHFAQPTYGIVFEVAQATGFRANRHLDAMAMGLWPSRGLDIHGIEVKVNYYDWKRERDTPEKAEELARFCDFFWIAAPKGIVPISELPLAWGLLEVDEDGRIKEAKAAAKTSAQPVGREFLAAVFRASSREVDPDTLDALIRKRERELETKFEERVKAAASMRSDANSRAAEHWAKLVEAVGEKPDEWFFSDHDLIDCIKAVHKAGVARSYAGLKSLRADLQKVLDQIAPVADAFGIGEHTPVDELGKRLRKSRRAA